MVRVAECMETGVWGAEIWEQIIPSDTGRVVRDASAPRLESCAFIDVAHCRSDSLSDFSCRSEKTGDYQV